MYNRNITEAMIFIFEVGNIFSYLNWTIWVSTIKQSLVVDEGTYSSTAFKTHLQDLCVNTRNTLLLQLWWIWQESESISIADGQYYIYYCLQIYLGHIMIGHLSLRLIIKNVKHKLAMFAGCIWVGYLINVLLVATPWWSVFTVAFK